MKRISFKNLATIALIFVLVIGAYLFFQSESKLDSKMEELSPQDFASMSLNDQMSLFDRWSRNYSFEDIRNYLYEEVYPNTTLRSHSLGHKLGEIVVNQEGMEGLLLCDNRDKFACYHGAVYELIRARGLSDSVISDIMSVCDGRSIGQGRCAHGMGHVAAVLHNYDIPKAFERCDVMMEDNYLRANCYNGVSMENTMHIAAHQYEEFDDSGKGVYPCNKLEPKYQNECVRYYIDYLMEEDESFDKVLGHCLSYSEEDVRRDCMGSVGISEVQRRGGPSMSVNEIADICNKTERYRSACLFDIVRWLVKEGRDDKAFEACNKITSHEVRERCTPISQMEEKLFQ